MKIFAVTAAFGLLHALLPAPALASCETELGDMCKFFETVCRPVNDSKVGDKVHCWD